VGEPETPKNLETQQQQQQTFSIIISHEDEVHVSEEQPEARQIQSSSS